MLYIIYILYIICYILNNFVCVLVCQFCTVSPVFCVICSHHSMPRSPGGGANVPAPEAIKSLDSMAIAREIHSSWKGKGGGNPKCVFLVRNPAWVELV